MVFFDRSTIKNKVSDYKVKPIKKVQVSEFPKGLSLCQFYGRPVKKNTIKKNNNDHIQMWKIYIYVADLTIASMGNTLEQHRMQIGRFHSRGLKISRKKIKIPLKERSLSFLGTSVLVLFLVNWLIGSAASGVQVGRGSDWGLPDSSPPSSTTCLVGFEKVRHLI